jgi:hypothetical protein
MTRTTFVATTLALAAFMICGVGSPPQPVRADPQQPYMLINNPTSHEVDIEIATANTNAVVSARIRPNETYQWRLQGTFRMTSSVRVGTTKVVLLPKEVTLNEYHKALLTIEREPQGSFYFR